jgi:hypothetical protein
MQLKRAILNSLLLHLHYAQTTNTTVTSNPQKCIGIGASIGILSQTLKKSKSISYIKRHAIAHKNRTLCRFLDFTEWACVNTQWWYPLLHPKNTILNFALDLSQRDACDNKRKQYSKRLSLNMHKTEIHNEFSDQYLSKGTCNK